MADGSIDSLTIEIGASSKGAIDAIKGLASSLRTLKNAVNGIDIGKLKTELAKLTQGDINKLTKLGNAVSGLKGSTISPKLPETISNLSAALDKIDQKHINKLIKFGDALKNMKDAKTSLGNMLPAQLLNIAAAVDKIPDDAIARINKLTHALGRLKGVDLRGLGSVMREQRIALEAERKSEQEQAGGENAEDKASSGGSRLRDALAKAAPLAQKLGSMLESAAQSAAKVAKHILSFAKQRIKIWWDKSSFKGLERAAGQVKNVLSSFGRIAFYRIIRSVIKAITQAFKEGLEHAYAFSQGITSEGHRFAEAMDSMATSSGTMKNQLGSAFISLLTAIAPIVNAIISLITRLADAISQLISAFTGSTYLKAADVPKEWADNAKKAGGAAKEWKNQLMSFDEINRLEEPSSGGGGGGAGVDDPMKMFQDSPIAENIKKFVDDFKAAIMAGDWQGAGELLGNKINELLPTEEQWKSWGKKLGYGLNGAIQTLYYTLKTIDFVAIGQRIAHFLNSALEEIDFGILGRLLVRKMTLALDFLIGFLGTLDWKLVGESIGDFLRGAFDEASEWLKDKDWEKVGKNLFKKLGELIEGIDFASLADSLFGFLGDAVGAAAAFLDGFFSDAWEEVKKYFKEEAETWGVSMWEGFALGVLHAWEHLLEWIGEHITKPLVEGVKNALGIHSPSTVFEGIGRDIVQGLFNGFTGAWESFSTTVSNLFSDLIGWCQSAHAWIQDVLDGIGLIGGGSQFGGWAADVKQFVPHNAQGGFPEDGLFMANHGELVGKFSNGKTAVANNEQITSGIAEAVYDAFMTAFSQTNGSGGSGQPVNIYLDGRQIAQSTTKYQNQFARASGM